MRKGEIACNKQVLLFLQCFLPYMALIFHLKCTLTLYQTTKFWTGPNRKHLQTTKETRLKK